MDFPLTLYDLLESVLIKQYVPCNMLHVLYKILGQGADLQADNTE